MTDTTPHRSHPVDTIPGRGPLIKAYAASLTGTALEYYDFAVYSAAAALVFPTALLPRRGPAHRHPAVVLHLRRRLPGPPDRRLRLRPARRQVGRKNVLVSTLVLIGVATLLIGLLPGYANDRRRRADHPGPAALRPGRRRRRRMGRRGAAVQRVRRPRASAGFWASAAQIGPPAGNLLANGALAVLAAVADRGPVPVLGLAGRVPDLRAAGRRSGCGSGSSWRTPRSSWRSRPSGERPEGADQGGLRHPEAPAAGRRIWPGSAPTCCTRCSPSSSPPTPPPSSACPAARC